MNNIELLNNLLDEKLPLNDIVRRFFLVHPTHAFEGNLTRADIILNQVSLKFSIPINDILVCGSAKIGFSLHKNTLYKPGTSDLDLAIINNALYCKIFNTILFETRNYSRVDLFLGNNIKKYRYGIGLGMINYNFMPDISLKKEMLIFFDNLSIENKDLFSHISCCFYMSEDSFKQKQINGLSRWKSENFKDYL